jgi:5-methylcytosine-specific restriction protein A
MPKRAGHPCAAPGCPAVVDSGQYCDEHRPPRPDDGRPSAAQRGYDGRWRKIRAMVLARRPLCVECERHGVVRVATEVDHIIPLSKGGTHATDNLQPLCKTCHSRKTRREAPGAM